MPSLSVYLITLFLSRLSPFSGKTVFVHILLPDENSEIPDQLMHKQNLVLCFFFPNIHSIILWEVSSVDKFVILVPKHIWQVLNGIALPWSFNKSHVLEQNLLKMSSQLIESMLQGSIALYANREDLT